MQNNPPDHFLLTTLLLTFITSTSFFFPTFFFFFPFPFSFKQSWQHKTSMLHCFCFLYLCLPSLPFPPQVDTQQSECVSVWRMTLKKQKYVICHICKEYRATSVPAMKYHWERCGKVRLQSFTEVCKTHTQARYQLDQWHLHYELRLLIELMDDGLTHSFEPSHG